MKIIEYIEFISKNRLFYYGVAILLVVFYHAYCLTNSSIFYLFKDGAIGVDIFIFLSGFGLAFSYKRSSICDFYIKRFIRIYPTMFLFTALSIIIKVVKGDCIVNMHGFYEWVEMFTFVIPFWRGIDNDWFTSGILQLYLIFPFFFYLIRKNAPVTLLLTTLLSLLVLYKCNLTWQQASFISRIPIFVYGIYLYNVYMSNKTILWLVPCTLITIVIFITLHPSNSRVFVLSSFLPYLLLVTAAVGKKVTISNPISSYVKKTIEEMGKSSYEIYKGHGFGGIAATGVESIFSWTCIYILFSAIFSFMLFSSSKIIQSWLINTFVTPKSK